MDDWLKNRPMLQLLLSGTITFIGLLIMFFIATGTNSSNALLDDIEKLKLNKATYPYVDKQNSLQDFKIELKADKSLVESMDAKLDIIISKFPN